MGHAFCDPIECFVVSVTSKPIVFGDNQSSLASGDADYGQKIKKSRSEVGLNCIERTRSVINCTRLLSGRVLSIQ